MIIMSSAHRPWSPNLALTLKEVVHIASLVRIGMSEQDLESFRDELSKILDQFEVLKTIDTENVAPTAHPVDINNVFKDDIATEPLDSEAVLSNAPRRVDLYFRVKAVLEE